MAREWLTGGGGGVNHVQTSEPTYAEGETWLNPDTGVYYAAYDAGNGGDWHPIPPVQVTDEATAFNGGDGESVSTSNELIVSGNQIQFKTGTTASRPDDNNSTSIGGGQWYGAAFNPNENLVGIDFTVSANTTGATQARIHDGSSTLVSESPGSYSPGDTISLTASLSSGTNYAAELYFPDGNICGYNNNLSTPYTSRDVDLNGMSNNGSINTGTTSVYAVEDITANLDITSGNALIYWGNPADLTSWDLATFQRTLDNEAVAVDVEDGSGNVLFSDISQNFDISTVSDSKEVRIRANFSRSDTANDPTLDYCARRYTR